MEQIWVCKEEQHNKVWSYQIISENSVLVKWGRLGVLGQSQTKTFPSQSKMQDFINKKISEKEKKGYKKTNQQEVKKDAQIAQELGVQNKINRIQFVDKKNKKLSFLGQYDPKRYVYVEILNSWSKEVSRYLLSKDQSYKIDSIAEVNRTIEFDNISECYSDKFVQVVRKVLREIASKVGVAVAKFAALGARSLSLGDDDEDIFVGGSSALDEILGEVGESVISKQVVSKFAALGARQLEL